jgi:thiamine pyrophosphokinase
MRALLVGPLARPEDIRSHKALLSTIIAVDGGLDVCRKAKVEPLFSVGDWDSYRGPIGKLPENRWDLPKEKGRSDLAYALKLVDEQDFSEVVAVGFQGGRFDHELGVHLDFLEAAGSGILVQSHGPRGVIHYLVKGMDVRLRLREGEIVSVFPFDATDASVKFFGFQYGVGKKPIRLQRTEGLSNVATGFLQRIWCKKGSVLVMLPETRKK